ncbi:MAG: DUF86 domain-containing protein [Comamonas sp.]|nr:DUF86 domain-containing protein [Comamonas sp.]
MELDIYQAETARTAAAQSAYLDEARQIVQSGRPLSGLEFSGLLHALQISVENAIGKAKRWLKAYGQVVPVSAYDAFVALAESGLIERADLPAWNAIIGLRNRIVHDYMNLDLGLVQQLVIQRKEKMIMDFLLRPYPGSNT